MTDVSKDGEARGVLYKIIHITYILIKHITYNYLMISYMNTMYFDHIHSPKKKVFKGKTKKELHNLFLSSNFGRDD